MPSRASPFSRVGAGAAYDLVSLIATIECSSFLIESYLVAAVDGGVLANTVDLVAGAGVDDVVRLGSVARHVCGFEVVVLRSLVIDLS